MKVIISPLRLVGRRPGLLEFILCLSLISSLTRTGFTSAMAAYGLVESVLPTVHSNDLGAFSNEARGHGRCDAGGCTIRENVLI